MGGHLRTTRVTASVMGAKLSRATEHAWRCRAHEVTTQRTGKNYTAKNDGIVSSTNTVKKKRLQSRFAAAPRPTSIRDLTLMSAIVFRRTASRTSPNPAPKLPHHLSKHVRKLVGNPRPGCEMCTQVAAFAGTCHDVGCALLALICVIGVVRTGPGPSV